MAESLAHRLDLKVAVETGTHLGDTAALLRQSFPEVWTVELSQDLHARAQARYRHLAGIHFLHGSSAEILSKVAGEIGQPALFWLDGHWTADSAAGSTAGEERQCPLLEEIAAIDAYGWSERSCILIDDARLFLGPPADPYRREDWPTFLEVLDLLRTRWPRFVTVLDDVIIAGPPESRPVVEDYWLGVLSRNEDDHSRLVQALYPAPLTAARRLVRAVLPTEVTRLYRSLRYRRGRLSDQVPK